MLQFKPTDGYEKLPTICLQAHLDMVGNKTIDSKHDFLKDPIDVLEENGWLKANNTTLGADNGIGMAYILAIFTSKEIKHGPLEAIFTVNEEPGCLGVKKLEPNKLKFKYLLNLDNETESEICIGSSGGRQFLSTHEIKRDAKINDGCCVTIELLHLISGHSGIAIKDKKANGIKEMFYLLKQLQSNFMFKIIDVISGNVDILNVIPNCCAVKIELEKNKIDDFKKELSIYSEKIKNSFIEFEKNIEFKVSVQNDYVFPISVVDTNNLVNFICIANNGLKYFDWKQNIPHTSNNLGAIKIENDQVKCGWYVRSFDEYDLDKIVYELKILIDSLNGKYEITKLGTPWFADTNNQLAVQTQKLAKEKVSIDMKLLAVPFGAEAGDILGIYPNTYAISIGPTIVDAHTPDEKVNLQSIDKIFNLLKLLLEEIK